MLVMSRKFRKFKKKEKTGLESCVLESLCYEPFDGRDVTVDDVTAHAHYHGVTVAEPVLEMLCTSETSESTVHHHSEPWAEHFTLLHADTQCDTS